MKLRQKKISHQWYESALPAHLVALKKLTSYFLLEFTIYFCIKKNDRGRQLLPFAEFGPNVK